MGLQAIYSKKNFSRPNKNDQKYPYLLKNKNYLFPNQVWATDSTYIRINGNFVYVVAIIDIYSRKVLVWGVSNTLDSFFYCSILEEALSKFEIPAVFSMDQGTQFTSHAFTQILKDHRIQISMDSNSKRRALDNIYIERLWRSLKYENIYLNNYESVVELKAGLKKFHQSLDYCTLMSIITRHLAVLN